ncbi:MAG: GPW/gp25 family protein [Roseivirga sp.]|nr:GPW/gp25 family protein [Roseivirga sp.]
MKEQDTNRSFLGRGWSFPPQFTKHEQGVSRLEMSEGEQDILESLKILLSTRLGERIMLPKFGCDLANMSFQSVSSSFLTYLKDIVRTAIRTHEPRIIIESIDILTDQILEGLVTVEVDFVVRSTNTRTNFVYPYYINEATNL